MGLEYKDMTGREIKAGNYVAYAATVRRSADMRVGLVLALARTKKSQPRYNYITKSNEEFIEPKIKIVYATYQTRSKKNEDGHFISLTASWEVQRTSTIARLDNVLIVSPVSFDPKMREVLEKAANEYGTPVVETVDIHAQIKALIRENGIGKVAVAFDELQERYEPEQVQQTSEVVQSSGNVVDGNPA